MTEYLTFFSDHIGNMVSRLNTDKEVHSFRRHINILVGNVNSVEFIDTIFSRLNSDNLVHSLRRLINILAEHINSLSV